MTLITTFLLTALFCHIDMWPEMTMLTVFSHISLNMNTFVMLQMTEGKNVASAYMEVKEIWNYTASSHKGATFFFFIPCKRILTSPVLELVLVVFYYSITNIRCVGDKMVPKVPCRFQEVAWFLSAPTSQRETLASLLLKWLQLMFPHESLDTWSRCKVNRFNMTPFIPTSSFTQ